MKLNFKKQFFCQTRFYLYFKGGKYYPEILPQESKEDYYKRIYREEDLLVYEDVEDLLYIFKREIEREMDIIGIYTKNSFSSNKKSIKKGEEPEKYKVFTVFVTTRLPLPSNIIDNIIRSIEIIYGEIFCSYKIRVFKKTFKMNHLNRILKECSHCEHQFFGACWSKNKKRIILYNFEIKEDRKKLPEDCPLKKEKEKQTMLNENV